MTGKTINYYLMDGTPSGCIKCTIGTWAGVLYRIPRTELERCKGIDHLNQSGTYFLFGKEEDTDENTVYIGQAGARQNGGGILQRLREHKRDTDKDYWTEAVVFTTSANYFGLTEISWLENYFCSLAKNAKRYIVKNGNHPAPGNVTMEKESELEEFAEYAKIVIGFLGHKVFEPLDKPYPIQQESGNVLLYINKKSRGQNIHSTCLRTDEGFVVKAGSIIKMSFADDVPLGIKKKRQEVGIDDNGVLMEDVLFKSPSPAAVFVLGFRVSGYNVWKNADGKTLREIEAYEAAVS